MKACALAVLCCLVLTCSRQPSDSDNGTAQGSGNTGQYSEKHNVLALSAGSVVTARSGELTLGTTPVHALDAAFDTTWTSPPSEKQQSFTVALPAPTTIHQFVMSTGALGEKGSAVKTLQVDYSSDGATFQHGTRIVSQAARDGQTFPVTPSTVRALRFTVVNTLSPSAAAFNLPSIEAHGKAVAPVVTPEVTGTWQINDQVLRLRRDGHRIVGTVDGDLPMHLEGGIEGNLIRFAWTRVNQAGYGLMTVDPSSRYLNALLWYERPILLFSAPTWIGSRTSPDVAFQMLSLEQMIGTSLKVIRRYSSYGVRFTPQGELDPSSSETLERLAMFAGKNPRFQFRLASVYFGSDPAGDRGTTDRRVAAMRAHLASKQLLAPNLQLVSSGGEIDKDPPLNIVDRTLFDRVDLDVVAPRPVN